MDVRTLTLPELEHIIEEYPWFTLAHKEYVRRQSQLGEEAVRQAAAEAGLFLMSREDFLNELNGRRRNVRQCGRKPEVVETPVAAVLQPTVAVEADAADVVAAPTAEVKTKEEDSKPKIYVTNGDYFDKDDYKSLEDEGLAFDTSALAFNPIASALSAIESNPTPFASQPMSDEPEKEDDLFCTETLAKIYVAQEFYQRAIDIYEKLILLYPKKSAYFASLIEQTKNIKTQ